MIGSRNDWKKIYNRFNHLQRLGATDMDLFVHRPGATVDAIETRLELDPRAKWVVCGSMGSGKSSELVRLHDRLKDKYAVARYLRAKGKHEFTLSEVRDLITAQMTESNGQLHLFTAEAFRELALEQTGLIVENEYCQLSLVHEELEALLADSE